MAQAPKELPSRNRLAVSGAEIILLIFLVMVGMGLWVWMERAFTAFVSEPTEQQFLNTPSINDKQEELARLEAVRKDAANQLLGAEVDQLKQRATMKSLESLHPGIEKNATAISAETVKNYEDARAQGLAATELINLLSARIVKSKADAEQVTKELDPQKQLATNEFQRAQRKYLLTKSAAFFVLPFLIIFLSLLIVRGFLSLVARGQVWTTQGSILSVVVVCALLILFAYQAFQLMGAVFVGTILFFFLLRKMKWSPRVGVPARVENAGATSHGREAK
jgi:hypothetical protein